MTADTLSAEDAEASPGVEITPEMIEAGADVLWRAFGDVMPYGSETGRVTATEVFLAMAPLFSSKLATPELIALGEAAQGAFTVDGLPRGKSATEQLLDAACAHAASVASIPTKSGVE